MAAEQPIPVYTNLQDLHKNLGTSIANIERWNRLVAEFERRFGRKPVYIARAPGRVNLIGEHIDYALFGVLPAAIERDVLIACAPRIHTISSAEPQQPGSVVAENLDPKYPRQTFSPTLINKAHLSDASTRTHGWHLDINTKELRWESYVKAGYYGILEHFFSPQGSVNNEEGHPIPVDLLVTGIVPSGSGLSSSAAMVVASSLAFLAVNGKLEQSITSSHGLTHRLTKGELVRIAMENEKRVGVNSGGMDQAASVISSPAAALYISFFPTLSASPVPLPSGAIFICANSLVVSDKAVTAKRRYNLRVVETLVGARILAKSLGVNVGEKAKITYREVIGRWVGEKVTAGGAEEGASVERLKGALEQLLGKLDVLKPTSRSQNVGEEEQLGVTMEEMIQMTGLSPDVFRDVYLSWVEVEATYFQLYTRAQHVLSESLRVLQFREICLSSSSSSSISTESTLEALGALMNASQSSCSALFDCSCPELDILTKLALQAGAYGSRLTGAGWGGCTVSLVAADKVNIFMRMIKETYEPYHGLEGERLEEVMFATRPGSGACVYKLEA
ncbi:hypothetical protein AMATHDRAFT_70991 [Amanita thiersii Skay4041]|uniref:Galactokinase n=1 Tax=Amanita thiersii Skay4041 TaxID=703135 RepID=A0A2A9NC85_9AGAR|nr:hypothetical protein AMATHDRAFT_70991 [Amanita thiersii Skay4041]